MRDLPAFLTLVLLLCVGAAGLSGATAPKAKPKPKPASDAWPEPESIDPRGRPEGQIHAKAARFYVFHVKDQWHVISTSQSKGLRFRGTISVDQGEIKAAVPIGKEKRDFIQLAPSHKQITFDFKTGTAADGLYFVVTHEVKQIKFDLDPPGAKRPRNQIFIGQQKANPSRCPFVLRVGE